jgi:DNA-directed RNA polymerase subunit RPC12/RpoP
MCGKEFTAYLKVARFCKSCRKIRHRQTTYKYNHVKRAEGLRNFLGTITYEKLEKLEKREISVKALIRSKVSGYAHFCDTQNETYRCSNCGSNDVIVIENGQPFCNECGSYLIVAHPNKYYLTIEQVCSKCGLVFQ